MKIYTKTGDNGTTGLLDGERVSKNSLRVNVYGTIDELNSIIGIITTLKIPEELKSTFSKLNNVLFEAGSDLASPNNTTKVKNISRIKEEHIFWLEKLIDEYDLKLPPLKNFILPGGTNASAYLHNARTVCRRAERLAVSLSEQENLGDYIIKFLNRLSDYLFMAARMVNFLSGVEDVIWKK